MKNSWTNLRRPLCSHSSCMQNVGYSRPWPLPPAWLKDLQMKQDRWLTSMMTFWALSWILLFVCFLLILMLFISNNFYVQYRASFDRNTTALWSLSSSSDVTLSFTFSILFKLQWLIYWISMMVPNSWGGKSNLFFSYFAGSLIGTL